RAWANYLTLEAISRTWSLLTVEVHLGQRRPETDCVRRGHREPRKNMQKALRHPRAISLPLGAATTLALAFALMTPPRAIAAEEAEVTISLKDHKFDPAEVKVPAE